MSKKKEVLPIEKDRKLASEIKRDSKEFEKLFKKCVSNNNKDDKVDKK